MSGSSNESSEDEEESLLPRWETVIGMEFLECVAHYTRPTGTFLHRWRLWCRQYEEIFDRMYEEEGSNVYYYMGYAIAKRELIYQKRIDPFPNAWITLDSRGEIVMGDLHMGENLLDGIVYERVKNRRLGLKGVKETIEATIRSRDIVADQEFLDRILRWVLLFEHRYGKYSEPDDETYYQAMEIFFKLREDTDRRIVDWMRRKNIDKASNLEGDLEKEFFPIFNLY